MGPAWLLRAREETNPGPRKSLILVQHDFTVKLCFLFQGQRTHREESNVFTRRLSKESDQYVFIFFEFLIPDMPPHPSLQRVHLRTG